MSKYQFKSNEILEKRNRYYKRRKQIINTVICAVIPLILVVNVFAFSKLFIPSVNDAQSSQRDYLFKTIEIQVTSNSGVSNIELSNWDSVDKIMSFICDKYENKLLAPPSESDSAYFEENEDYLIKVTDKSNKILIFCITPNSILSAKTGNVYITKNDYNTFKNLLKNA